MALAHLFPPAPTCDVEPALPLLQGDAIERTPSGEPQPDATAPEATWLARLNEVFDETGWPDA